MDMIIVLICLRGKDFLILGEEEKFPPNENSGYPLWVSPENPMIPGRRLHTCSNPSPFIACCTW